MKTQLRHKTWARLIFGVGVWLFLLNIVGLTFGMWAVFTMGDIRVGRA